MSESKFVRRACSFRQHIMRARHISSQSTEARDLPLSQSRFNCAARIWQDSKKPASGYDEEEAPDLLERIHTLNEYHTEVLTPCSFSFHGDRNINFVINIATGCVQIRTARPLREAQTVIYLPGIYFSQKASHLFVARCSLRFGRCTANLSLWILQNGHLHSF